MGWNPIKDVSRAVSRIGDSIGSGAENIGDAIGSGAGNIGNIVGNVTNPVGDFFGRLPFDAIKQDASSLFRAIDDEQSRFGSMLRSDINKTVGRPVKKAWGNTWGSGKDFVSRSVDSIGGEKALYGYVIIAGSLIAVYFTGGAAAPFVAPLISYGGLLIVGPGEAVDGGDTFIDKSSFNANNNSPGSSSSGSSSSPSGRPMANFLSGDIPPIAIAGVAALAALSIFFIVR